MFWAGRSGAFAGPGRPSGPSWNLRGEALDPICPQAHPKNGLLGGWDPSYRALVSDAGDLRMAGRVTAKARVSAAKRIFGPSECAFFVAAATQSAEKVDLPLYFENTKNNRGSEANSLKTRVIFSSELGAARC